MKKIILSILLIALLSATIVCAENNFIDDIFDFIIPFYFVLTTAGIKHKGPVIPQNQIAYVSLGTLRFFNAVYPVSQIVYLKPVGVNLNWLILLHILLAILTRGQPEN